MWTLWSCHLRTKLLSMRHPDLKISVGTLLAWSGDCYISLYKWHCWLFDADGGIFDSFYSLSHELSDSETGFDFLVIDATASISDRVPSVYHSDLVYVPGVLLNGESVGNDVKKWVNTTEKQGHCPPDDIPVNATDEGYWLFSPNSERVLFSPSDFYEGGLCYG